MIFFFFNQEKQLWVFHTLNPRCYMTMLQKQKPESEVLGKHAFAPVNLYIWYIFERLNVSK